MGGRKGSVPASNEHSLVPTSTSIPEGIPCFPPRVKAEMGRHKGSLVGWLLSGVKGKPPHRDFQHPQRGARSGPWHGIGVFLLALVLKQFRGSQNIIQRASDCKAGQSCLNNSPNSRVFGKNVGGNTHLFCVGEAQTSLRELWNLPSPCNAPARSC